MFTAKLRKKIIKKVSLLSAITLTLNMSMAGVFFVGLPAGATVEATGAEKVTICHATESASNPWNRLVVSPNATNGHFDEQGTPLFGHEEDLLFQGEVDCPAPEPYCGDKEINRDWEQCDDGNNENGDGCDSECQNETPVCGNGQVEGDEQCDDGNTENGDGCDAECMSEEPSCDGADYEFNLDPYMSVVGVDCHQSNKITDSTSIEVPGGGAYNVKGISHRGKAGQFQINESYYIEINGDNGPVSEDDPEADAITIRLDDLGNFNFNSGFNTVNMNTAAECPPDEGPNSVDLSKLCLYKIAECGDEYVDDGEECDDGANGDDTDECYDDCTLTYCGDGLIQTPNGYGQIIEECDGSAGVGEHQTCDNDCQLVNLTYCGDNIKQTPNDEGTGGPQDDGNEECDGQDGVPDEHYTCNSDCTLEYIPYCGDGEVNTQDEECDYGQDNGLECTPPYGGSCTYCNAECEEITLEDGDCGDGVLDEEYEQCDDGNRKDGDGCNSQCANEYCGDGTTNNIDEECDDGNENNLDECRNDCTVPYCGDEIIDEDEECDDGDTESGDGCSADCLVEPECPTGAKIKINFSTIENTGTGDMTNNYYTGINPNPFADGTWIDLTNNGYMIIDNVVNEDIPGLAIKRGPGWVFISHYGSHTPGGTGYEKSDATITFENSMISGFRNVNLEKQGDGIYTDSAGQDEVFWTASTTSSDIFTRVTTHNDSFYIEYVCELPSCGDGAVNQDWEKCDDGNNENGDGCDSECQTEGGPNPTCGDGIPGNTPGEQCDDGNNENGDGCDAECQLETCEHDVGIRYTYGNSFGTGIAIRPSGGDWIDDPVQLLRNFSYDIKYYIDNHIEDSTNNINVVLKNDETVLADYDSEIITQHYKTVNFDTTGLALGTSTLSLSVSKINEIDCNMDDNYAEREVEIIAVCGDGITDENLNEQCDDGNDIDDDGCRNNCTLPSGGPEYGSIKACKYMDDDGDLESTGDQAPVFGWEFILDDGVATTSQMTDQEIGCAVFSNLLAGDYEISETLGDGWVALWPEGGNSTVAVAANEQTQIDFINTKMGTISGYKFEDNDLASSTNELLPVEGWAINLAHTISSTTPIGSTITDANGYYEFSVMPGEYTVAEVMQAGWEAVGSSSLDIIIASGDTSEENNFINHFNPYCGDGEVNRETEQCDGSAGVGEHQSCTAECTIENIPYCGDGKITDGEQCDDGNTAGGDGCSASCTTEGGGGGTFIITGGGGGSTPIVLGEEGAPSLAIEKTVNIKFINPGDEIEYKVKVINNGNLTAFSVSLNDTLPAGFTFSDDGTSVKTINVGDLSPGENKEFTFKAMVSGETASGIYANIAQAYASNHDPVSDYADVEVREIEVLGVELAPTGFDMKEFMILIAALLSLSGLAVILRRKYKHSL